MSVNTEWTCKQAFIIEHITIAVFIKSVRTRKNYSVSGKRGVRCYLNGVEFEGGLTGGFSRLVHEYVDCVSYCAEQVIFEDPKGCLSARIADGSQDCSHELGYVINQFIKSQVMLRTAVLCYLVENSLLSTICLQSLFIILIG